MPFGNIQSSKTITSINGDKTPDQILTGGSGIAVSSTTNGTVEFSSTVPLWENGTTIALFSSGNGDPVTSQGATAVTTNPTATGATGNYVIDDGSYTAYQHVAIDDATAQSSIVWYDVSSVISAYDNYEVRMKVAAPIVADISGRFFVAAGCDDDDYATFGPWSNPPNAVPGYGIYGVLNFGDAVDSTQAVITSVAGGDLDDDFIVQQTDLNTISPLNLEIRLRVIGTTCTQTMVSPTGDTVVLSVERNAVNGIGKYFGFGGYVTDGDIKAHYFEARSFD